MLVIRTYKLNDNLLETLKLFFSNNNMTISINGSVLDYESFQYQIIDIKYINVNINEYIITNEFISNLLDIIHEPFPNNYDENNNLEVITKFNDNIIELVCERNELAKRHGNIINDTEKFIKDYTNGIKRVVENKKYDSLLCDN